jgi:hypothetical protein
MTDQKPNVPNIKRDEGANDASAMASGGFADMATGALAGIIENVYIVESESKSKAITQTLFVDVLFPGEKFSKSLKSYLTHSDGSSERNGEYAVGQFRMQELCWFLGGMDWFNAKIPTITKEIEVYDFDSKSRMLKPVETYAFMAGKSIGAMVMATYTDGKKPALGSYHNVNVRRYLDPVSLATIEEVADGATGDELGKASRDFNEKLGGQIDDQTAAQLGKEGTKRNLDYLKKNAAKDGYSEGGAAPKEAGEAVEFDDD